MDTNHMSLLLHLFTVFERVLLSSQVWNLVADTLPVAQQVCGRGKLPTLHVHLALLSHDNPCTCSISTYSMWKEVYFFSLSLCSSFPFTHRQRRRKRTLLSMLSTWDVSWQSKLNVLFISYVADAPFECTKGKVEGIGDNSPQLFFKCINIKYNIPLYCLIGTTSNVTNKEVPLFAFRSTTLL